MPTTIRRLADLVQGEVHGDADLVIQSARPLSDAGPGDITFAESTKYADRLHACRASAALVPCSLPTNGLTVIRVADPLTAFITVYRHLLGRSEPPPHGIDPRACVAPTVLVGADPSILPLAIVGAETVIGARCRIESGVVIGRRCRLGDDVVLHPGVVLYDDTVLGNRVVVHANSVLGADGFGYRVEAGRHVKVPQLGWVEVADDVEIGACTTIDRGTFGPTRIGAGTKIDNLVQVAHNCQIGRHNLLISQMGIAGSSTTGDYVVAAGQVGIADHVKIGDGVIMGAKSGVTKNLAAGERVLGSPATPLRDQQRIIMCLDKLPEMRRDIRRIKLHLGMTDEP